MAEASGLYLPGPTVSVPARFGGGSHWRLVADDLAGEHVTAPLARFATAALRPPVEQLDDLTPEELRELLALGQAPAVNDQATRLWTRGFADYFRTLPFDLARQRAEVLADLSDQDRHPRLMSLYPAYAGALTLANRPVGELDADGRVTLVVCPAAWLLEDQVEYFGQVADHYGGGVVCVQARPGPCAWSIEQGSWPETVAAYTNAPRSPANEDIAAFRAYRHGLDRTIAETLTAVRMECRPDTTIGVVAADEENGRFTREPIMSAVALGGQIVLPPAMHRLLERARTGADVTRDDVTADETAELGDLVTRLTNPEPRPSADEPPDPAAVLPENRIWRAHTTPWSQHPHTSRGLMN